MGVTAVTPVTVTVSQTALAPAPKHPATFSTTIFPVWGPSRVGLKLTAAFTDLGAGMYREGGAARSSTTSTFGGGVGVRRIVGDRHGIVRAELRADRLHSDAVLGRPALNFVGLRLGFDLWL